MKDSVRLRLGHRLDGGAAVEIRFGELTSPHFLYCGLSGSGKSRALTDYVLQMIEQGVGVTVVDPGDLVEDILAHQAAKMIRRSNKNVLKRLHYLEPGNYATSFRLDPFRFDPAKPIHPEVRPAAYRAWLHATVQRVGELVQLKQGQVNFEQNARLQRVLTNLLMATGMAVDGSGRHLPLSAALILLQIDDPMHEQVYQRVAPLLDRDTRADFERLRGYRREEDRLREVESTINRLRSVLSPIAKAIFSGMSYSETVNPRKIILERGVMLWNLRPTEYFSQDSKTTFGKLAIHTTLSTMMSMPRDMRQPHVLVIDEASEFADEMLLWSLGAMRKTGDPFSIVLAAQNLCSFRKADGFDMRSKVVSQCNLVVFNQTWPEDTEVLSRVLFTDLDFTPLTQEVERDGGYEWVEVTETSENVKLQAGTSSARATSESTTDTTGTTSTVSDATTSGVSDGTTAAATKTGYTSESRGEVRPPGGELGPRSVTRASGGGDANSNGTSRATNSSASRTVSNGSSQSQSSSAGKTETQSENESVAVGSAVSHKKMPMHQVRTEVVKTGALERAVADQLEEGRCRIASQRKRQAFVKIQGRPDCPQILTREVPDAFASPQALVRRVEWVKRELYALHPYYTAPSLDPTDEERDIREGYLEADEPVAVEEPDPFD